MRNLILYQMRNGTPRRLLSVSMRLRGPGGEVNISYINYSNQSSFVVCMKIIYLGMIIRNACKVQWVKTACTLEPYPPVVLFPGPQMFCLRL